MAPVFDNSWRTGPLGDSIEQVLGVPTQCKGYTRALENWNRLMGSMQDISTQVQYRRTLSGAQKNSFRLLLEWWNSETQDESLSRAARDSIEETAGKSGEGSDHLDIDREKSRLKESTYHQNFFLLFQLEFVHESRLLQMDNWEEFLGLLHAQREKCAQFAALQRIALSFLVDEASASSNAVSTVPSGMDSQRAPTLPVLLKNIIGACIEPCPWLKSHETEAGHPFYLWDVEKRCTIQVDQKPIPPHYICISHTWGRWRKKKESLVEIHGVPWRIPQNSKFDVLKLPDMLSQSMGVGYVWFDLLCIPQDRSVRALTEISRQAVIFSNAISTIAWINDVESWNGLRAVAKWLSLFYLHTSVAEDASAYSLPDLPDPYEIEEEEIELFTYMAGNSQNEEADEDLSFDGSPQPWFSSLWTLQEACLRPDIALCDRNWKPLLAGPNVAITLDHLVALSNFIARKTFRATVLEVKVT
jgi:Heterokaryon incompatibility protein (HET)